MRNFLRLALFTFLIPAHALHAGKQLTHSITIEDKDISEGVNGLKRWIGEQLLEFDIHAEFSNSALTEVQNFEDHGLELDSLEDWRHIPFVTIDNDDSKDLDQAVAIKKDLENGGYVVHYAIADTAYFLTPGSALEAEAKKRCLTSYLPDRNVPVMPRALSEGLCSLNSRVERRAVIASITLDNNGREKHTSFHHGNIYSRAQLSYRLVQELYDDAAASALTGHDYTESLYLLKELGQKLIDLSTERGVFQRESYELVTDIGQTSISCAISSRYRVEAYNEQISIISNRAAAKFTEQHDIPTIHRFHEGLSGATKKQLRKTLAAIGRPWHGTLQEYVATLDTTNPVDDAALQNIFRSFTRAKYDNVDSGHFGLKLSHYDHFTAPMRRFGDTIVHRAILSVLEPHIYTVTNKEAHNTAEKMTEASDRERQLSNTIKRKVSSIFLTPYEGEILTGYIQFQAPRGMSIHLDDMPFDIWLPKNKKNNRRKNHEKKSRPQIVRYKTGVRYNFRIVDMSNLKQPKIEILDPA
ncbi:MAG: ribonuclease catalytic domain-containing protein [Oligoflexales bacterium]